jgi:hypothetical protein
MAPKAIDTESSGVPGYSRLAKAIRYTTPPDPAFPSETRRPDC